MMIKVHTLSPADFENACSRLRDMLGNFDADLVVAIPTGGRYVADSMYTDKTVVEISLHRPSTKHKEKPIIKWILQKAPYPLLNLMRILESYALQMKKHHISHIAPESVPGSTASAIRQAKNILIVDDAVDSGATLGAVKEVVKAISPDACIKTAVLTVSTPHPIIHPDFALFNNTTLLRFPWSMDTKTDRQRR